MADWWQVFSPTIEYVDEAAFFGKLFKDAGVSTLLELGSGGGNVASFLKNDFEMTLTDLSPEMLENSRRQNPDCEHFLGDMLDLRLDRTFDGVFIHDAIMYMLSEAELRSAFETAYEHCKPGGTLIVAPDCTRETFKAITRYDGNDMELPDTRSVRYIQWNTDPDPEDTKFDCDFIIALKNGSDLRTIVDRQTCGLFSRKTWLDLLDISGFDVKAVEDTSMADEENERAEVFVGVRR